METLLNNNTRLNFHKKKKKKISEKKANLNSLLKFTNSLFVILYSFL